MNSNFIPKPYRKDPITIRVDSETLEKIDYIAQYCNLTRSEFVNRCISYSLEHYHIEEAEEESR